MSAKHTLKLLWEAEQEYGSVIRMIKERKTKAKMFNLPNGLSQLTNAIAQQLNSHIQLDCQIKKIKRKG